MKRQSMLAMDKPKVYIGMCQCLLFYKELALGG